MRWGFVLAALAVGSVQAQSLPSAVPLQAEQLPAVSTTQPVPPAKAFSVEGVVVKLDASEGFNRDMALTQAARQALPVALGQLEPPVPASKAADIAKNVGDPMTFVKSYKLVKEVLVPAYQLTANLQFDGAKLQTNFGSKVPVVKVEVAAEVSDTETVTPASAISDATVSVVLEADTAGAQDELFSKLEQAGMNPVWQLIRRDGATVTLNTALEGDALADKLRKADMTAEAVDGVVTVRP